MPKRKKKPYFHHNVDAIKEAPLDCFPGLEFVDLMDCNISGYEIPASVLCIIREHTHTGKRKEHVYQRRHAANKKIKKLILEGKEFTIIDHQGCQHIDNTIPEYDDPLA